MRFTFLESPGRQLVDSTVAARLNGYVAGRGTVEQLAQELAGFGLSSAAATHLQQLVRSKPAR